MSVTGGTHLAGQGGRSTTIAGSWAMPGWMVGPVRRQWSQRRSSMVPLMRFCVVWAQAVQRRRPGAQAHQAAGCGDS
jgi:hypothetical protein